MISNHLETFKLEKRCKIQTKGPSLDPNSGMVASGAARGGKMLIKNPLSDPGGPTFDPIYQVLQPFTANIQ